MEYLICKKCGNSKLLNYDNFYWRKDSQKWRTTCIQCISEQKIKKYQNDPEPIKNKAAVYRNEKRKSINEKAIIYNSLPETKLRNKIYRQNNKETLRKKEKEWKIKNPEKAKQINRKKAKKQREKPINKIRNHISRQVNFALHRIGSSKRGNSVIKFLNYSIDDLKLHLEKQFEPWMNWTNYGIYKKTWDDNDQSTWTWQIDHIIPQSSLLYTSMQDDNFKKCWSLDNLRPLNSKTNSIDGAQRNRHT